MFILQLLIAIQQATVLQSERNPLSLRHTGLHAGQHC